jgi:hypothetical protein
MHADVHEPPAGRQHPGRLGQYGRVGGHVGVRHHRDHRPEAVVAGRQPGGVGQDGGQAATGMPQHRGRYVDTTRRPAQFPDLARAHARAAADLQARARARAEQGVQRRLDAQRVTAR